MESRWRGPKRDAIHKLDPLGFDGRLAEHNPIFFLACHTFFCNEIDGVPAYLRPEIVYPPLHRDRFCKEFSDYLLSPSGGDQGLLVLAQRDSLKSTFSQNAVPLWYFLRMAELYDRYARIALLHFKEIQASINLVSLKNQCITNPWMKRTWPERCTDRDFGTKTEFTFPNVPTIGAREHSVIARGLGASLVGMHFDLICFDDLVEESHRTSKALRDDTAAKYDAVQYTLDTIRGKKIHTGTPYHPMDQWGKMTKAQEEAEKKNERIYRIVRIPAIDKDGTLSFPTRHTREFLAAKRQEEVDRSGNDDFFQLQMLCELRSTRMLACDPSWLRFVPLKDVPPGGWRVIIVDPAWKGTKNSGEGDSASIQVWELYRHGPWIVKYLLDGVHSNELTDRDGKNEIFRLMRHWGVQDVAPEEIGTHAFRTSLADEANTRGVFMNVIDLKHANVNKPQRITAFFSEMQAGRVFIAEECEPNLVRHFKDQFFNYPQVDHDDAVDCAAYTLDPAIADSYAPYFNTALNEVLRAGAQRPAPPPRSLHCGQ
jgi:hypothetical protein